MSCSCLRPCPAVDPRRKDTCLRCALPIEADGDWCVNDRTHNAFFNRVETALRASQPGEWKADEDGEVHPPPAWVHFRNEALQRERDGRERFGLAYLDRDNIQAGAEESEDGINYTYFDTRQKIREGRDIDWDLVLTAAYHDYMAYLTRLKMRAKAQGSP